MTTQLQEFRVISAVTGNVTTITQEVDVHEQPELSPEELRSAMPPISRRQLRLTLVRNDIPLDIVTSIIEGLPDGISKEEAKIEWDDAVSFDRMSPIIITIAGKIGITEERLDDIWRDAITA